MENLQNNRALFLSSLLLRVADLHVGAHKRHDLIAGRPILGCIALDSQQGGRRTLQIPDGIKVSHCLPCDDFLSSSNHVGCSARAFSKAT